MSTFPTDTPQAATLTEQVLLQWRVERFVVEEAALLDAWRLDDWLALFTDDATYTVPATDQPEADHRTNLMLIDDDRMRLGWRVKRLQSRHAHREYPYSRTRRMVSNVRVLAAADGEVQAEAYLTLHRFRREVADHFVGRCTYTLVDDGSSFAIADRRAVVDNERLTPNGALSVIF